MRSIEQVVGGAIARMAGRSLKGWFSKWQAEAKRNRRERTSRRFAPTPPVASHPRPGHNQHPPLCERVSCARSHVQSCTPPCLLPAGRPSGSYLINASR